VAPILELQWLYTMAIGNGLSTICNYRIMRVYQENILELEYAI